VSSTHEITLQVVNLNNSLWIAYRNFI